MILFSSHFFVTKVIKTVEEIKQAGVKMLRDEEWREEEGLILRDRKVYIPKDKRLRAEVIWLHHDTVTVVPWTSSRILYGLPLHQKSNISKATC